MRIVTVQTRPDRVTADALVVGQWAGDRRLPPALAAVDGALGGTARRALLAERFEAKVGQATHVFADGRLGAGRVVVVGLGSRREASLERLRRAAAAGVRRARDAGARTVAIEVLGEGRDVAERAGAVVEGALLGTYRYERYKRKPSDRAVETLVLLATPDARQAASGGAARGRVFAEAASFARDLVNGPANDVHPTHLADVARTIANERRLGLEVLDAEACRGLGMGAFLGVAQGSVQPPAFIHLTWKPRGARRRLALIGKGITFDSGGLDLKPADGMLRMKDDMAGAAAVLAVMRALPALAPRVEVHGLVAATENMPSGTALRPGDVLRAMDGTTIEIGNTDAEGRLTLADALAYARQKVEADEIVDVATLTGACVVALGPLCAGLFSSQDALAARLTTAAEQAGEPLWRLPLLEDYREHLKSDVADLNNVGPRGGGAITAGLFLREFVGKTPWAHLDIAGPAFVEKDGPLGPRGASGVPVRTLLCYVLARAAGGR